MPQTIDRTFVRLGHHSEESGPMRQKRVRNGKVGGERQRSILQFRFPLRPKGEREATVRTDDELLLRRVHPCGASSDLGLFDAAGKLGEVDGQIGWFYSFVGEFGARSDHRSHGPVER